MFPRPSAKLPPKVAFTLVMPPSSSLVCEYVDSISTPSKSFFMMKFSAPETASEPYTADAPPVTISMRSTSAVGIIEVSTMPKWL